MGLGTRAGAAPQPLKREENEIPGLVQERKHVLRNLPPAPRTNIVQILGRGRTLPGAWVVKKENPTLQQRKGGNRPPRCPTGPSTLLPLRDQSLSGAKIKITTEELSEEHFKKPRGGLAVVAVSSTVPVPGAPALYRWMGR